MDDSFVIDFTVISVIVLTASMIFQGTLSYFKSQNFVSFSIEFFFHPRNALLSQMYALIFIIMSYILSL